MLKWVKHHIGESKVEHKLYFSHHYGEEECICTLFRGDESGDWIISSELLDACFEKLFRGMDNSKIDLRDAKIEVQERIFNHYDDERKYYQEILDELNE